MPRNEKIYRNIIHDRTSKNKGLQNYLKMMGYSEQRGENNIQKTQAVQVAEADKHTVWLAVERAAQAVFWAYTVSGVIDWYHDRSNANDIKRGVQIPSMLTLFSKTEGIGATKDTTALGFDQLLKKDLHDPNMSLQNKILAVALQTNQYGLRNLLDRQKDQPAKDAYLQEAYTEVSKFINTYLVNERTFTRFLNRFVLSDLDEASNLYKQQLKANGVDALAEKKAIFNLLLPHVEGIERFEHFHSESEHETATVYNVFHVLAEAGMLDKITDTMFMAFSEASVTLNQKLQTAATNVFQQRNRVTQPFSNEEVTEFRDRFKKRYYTEAAGDQFPKPQVAGQQQTQPVAAQKPQTTIQPTTQETQKIESAKPVPENKPAVPQPPQQEKNTQYGIAKSEAMRQVVTMTLISLITLTFQALQQASKKIMQEQTNEEATPYSEGVMSFVGNTLSGMGKELMGVVRYFHGLPSDFDTIVKDKTKFKETIQYLVNKSNNGSLQVVLKHFNLDRVLHQFDERIFNAHKLADKAVQEKLVGEEALAEMRALIVNNLNAITETDIQRILEVAYDSEAPNLVRSAQKVVNKIQNIKTGFKV